MKTILLISSKDHQNGTNILEYVGDIIHETSNFIEIFVAPVFYYFEGKSCKS